MGQILRKVHKENLSCTSDIFLGDLPFSGFVTYGVNPITLFLRFPKYHILEFPNFQPAERKT